MQFISRQISVQILEANEDLVYRQFYRKGCCIVLALEEVHANKQESINLRKKLKLLFCFQSINFKKNKI